MADVVQIEALQGKNTVRLARQLLGRLLVRRLGNGAVSRHRISEVEAYVGEHDLASHARKGRTKRTVVMYRPGGIWYVYLCYGVHEMLNLVTGPAEFPAAILIRGVQDLEGPGRLTRQLAIDRRLNGVPAVPDSGLWLEDDGWRPARGAVRAGPRVGVDYAGPVWAAKPWRFRLDLGKGANPPGG